MFPYIRSCHLLTVTLKDHDRVNDRLDPQTVTLTADLQVEYQNLRDHHQHIPIDLKMVYFRFCFYNNELMIYTKVD